MARRHLAALGAVAILSFAGAAWAQTSAPQPAYGALKTFVAVDAVSSVAGRVYVRGVLDGDSAVTEWYVWSGVSGDTAFAENCQRAALLAMAKPGQYTLSLQYNSSLPYSTCRLSRVVP